MVSDKILSYWYSWFVCLIWGLCKKNREQLLVWTWNLLQISQFLTREVQGNTLSEKWIIPFNLFNLPGKKIEEKKSKIKWKTTNHFLIQIGLREIQTGGGKILAGVICGICSLENWGSKYQGDISDLSPRAEGIKGSPCSHKLRNEQGFYIILLILIKPFWLFTGVTLIAGVGRPSG